MFGIANDVKVPSKLVTCDNNTATPTELKVSHGKKEEANPDFDPHTLSGKGETKCEGIDAITALHGCTSECASKVVEEAVVEDTSAEAADLCISTLSDKDPTTNLAKKMGKATSANDVHKIGGPTGETVLATIESEVPDHPDVLASCSVLEDAFAFHLYASEIVTPLDAVKTKEVTHK